MVYKCKKCGKVYYYDVKKCIFCRSELVEQRGKKFKVIASTEVFVPSPEHRQVPYFDVLAEDEYGNLEIKKSNQKYKEGEIFEIDEAKKEKKRLKIGVIGTGVTGVGIAEVCLLNGFVVTLVSRTEEKLGRASSEIERFLAKFLDGEEKKKVLLNYKPSTSLNDLKDVDIIIESVIEDKKTKDEYLKKLDLICRKDAIIATNTSSLSIDDLSKNLKDPSRFLGIHFFNPVPKMALVEIVKGKSTSEKTVKSAVDFAEALGKVPVTTKDSPCFIVNRILMPYLNEAALLYGEGVATKEDIDKAAKLGLNHSMGPLSLLDLIGIDVFVEIMNNLYNKMKNSRYKVAPAVEELVKKGRLGRKSGEGFFRYS